MVDVEVSLQDESKSIDFVKFGSRIFFLITENDIIFQSLKSKFLNFFLHITIVV